MRAPMHGRLFTDILVARAPRGFAALLRELADRREITVSDVIRGSLAETLRREGLNPPSISRCMRDRQAEAA